MGIPGVIRDPFFLQPSHLFPYNPYKRSYGPLLITPFLSVTQVAVALSVLIHSTAWMVLQPPQVWSWKVEGHAGRTIKSMRSQIKGSKKWYYYMDIDITVVILYTPSLIMVRDIGGGELSDGSRDVSKNTCCMQQNSPWRLPVWVIQNDYGYMFQNGWELAAKRASPQKSVIPNWHPMFWPCISMLVGKAAGCLHIVMPITSKALSAYSHSKHYSKSRWL